jgi:beta-galactosidase
LEEFLKDFSMTLFNNNWKFSLSDARNAHTVSFCDRTWENIDLPHDWVISQPFFKGPAGGYTAHNMQGFFAWKGVCWYRKEFNLAEIGGRRVFIYFGGAYRNSTVYVNGLEAGSRASGYSSFEIDISNYVKEGKNLIAVRLDNGCEEPDRWYSGSGLFRNVFLKIVPVTRIKTWGVHIKTKLADDKKQADISVAVTVAGRASPSAGGQSASGKTAGGQSSEGGSSGIVRLRIFAPDGKLVAESPAEGSASPFDLRGKEEVTVEQTLRIENPALWSAETPELYTAQVSLETDCPPQAGADTQQYQSVETLFGIRAVEIAYNSGITVNGRKVKLKGVCLHHDAGITGAAYYDDVWRRRLLELKSIGCNAVRTSHNPPAEEFLDLCDELGFYVVDECFDKWKSGYYAEHFDADSQRDLTDFILRDRNHPCVVIWSVGNEVENQGADSMLAIQKRLVGIVRSLDSRPVTCALAPHANPRTLVGAPPGDLVKLTKKLAADVDILGLNYHEPLYPHYTQAVEKPILGTECYEYYSSVGTNYEDVCEKNPWRYVQESDNVIGQFIWAGIDYLGESTWPAKGWSGSILDICGFKKPNAFFRRSLWAADESAADLSANPFIYLAFYDQSIKNDYARGRWSFPRMASHLNFDHFARRTVKTAVFTNCEEAQLWINGKKMGNRKRADFENGIIEWTFEYAAGNIEVKGLNAGKEVCSYSLKTAGQAQKIKLAADKLELKAGSGDIAHIEVAVTDKDGLLYPNEEFLIEFELKGDARFLGACSPDLNQNLGFTLPKVVTSGGRALAMIKAGDSGGTVELCAYCEKLEKALLRFKVK